MNSPTSTIPCAALLSLSVACSLSGQDTPAPTLEVLCDEQPRHPPTSWANVGSARFQISCENAESQRHFDQGVCYLHGGSNYEAERCFRRVADLEPGIAMAYWGMAMANITAPGRAVDLIKIALRKRAQASAHERELLDAVADYFEVTPQSLSSVKPVVDEDEPDPDRVKAPSFQRSASDRGRRLVDRYAEILASRPGDPEATALLVAQELRNRDSGIPLSDPEKLDGQLTGILTANPKHPAHRYRMQLWLATHPRRALASAKACATATPGSANHWHLSAEVLSRCGFHHLAIRHRRAAMRIHHATMARFQEMPFRVLGYAANLEALCADYRRVGQARKAIALAKYMTGLPRHPKFNRPRDHASLAGRGASILIDTCREFRLLDELKELVEGGHLDTGSSQRDAVHVTTQLTNAYLDLGELAAAKALMPKVTALRADLWDAATARALDQAIREQRALLAIREQRGAEAREALRISGMPATKLADCYLSLGLTAQARRVLEEANGPSPDVAKTTRLILLPAPAGEDARRKLFESLRTQAAGGDLSLPLLQQLAPLAKSFGFPEDWRNNIPGRAADHDDHGIGPERWRPPAATDFTLLRSNSKKHRLSDHQGQPVVVIFYLGFGCLHCVEQLRDFHPHVDAYRDAGLEILAIGTDSVQNMQEARAELPYAEKFAYTMLSDAKEKVFRQWRAFDFFAAEIMHGTFLVDPGGRMVFQDISHEPFNHPAWFLEECQRLLGRVK